jgi:hypothetical protein
MVSIPRVPARVPSGTKYVLESHGSIVRRYIEFPNGRRVQLATRKALSCKCAAWQQISIAPGKRSAVVDARSLRSNVVA